MERISIELLTRMPPVVASMSDKVSTLVASMVSNDIGSIVVTNNGKPVGIVTEKDVIEKVVEKGKDPNRMIAQDVMSSPIITIEYNISVGEALRLMRGRGVRRLAVIKDGELMGIVTERRLLLWSTLK